MYEGTSKLAWECSTNPVPSLLISHIILSLLCWRTIGLIKTWPYKVKGAVQCKHRHDRKSIYVNEHPNKQTPIPWYQHLKKTGHPPAFSEVTSGKYKRRFRFKAYTSFSATLPPMFCFTTSIKALHIFLAEVLLLQEERRKKGRRKYSQLSPPP